MLKSLAIRIPRPALRKAGIERALLQISPVRDLRIIGVKFTRFA
jgi:hypothetical protein